ncbi:MAG: class I SAM-dependent methyltransferase [Elusimicrobiales bacterium]|nr:class I SAM-dependent methyltransferase [Elusimicrobiales bacterium]
MASYKIISFYDYIYKHYRVINSVITLGMDNLWRKKAVKIISCYIKDEKNTYILDCACGCGDITFYLKKFFKNSNIVGIDGNLNMLSLAKEKIKGITFLQTQCESLPFKNEHFDAVIVSFAMRNIYYSGNKEKIFLEIYRVLKKGGILFTLETSYPENVFLGLLLKIYLSFVFNFLFIFINSDEKNAYIFLKSSILNFRDKDFIESINHLFEVKRILLIPYIVSLCVCFKKSY